MASAPQPEELAEQLDDGVWLINGGYVALVAEFEDHLLVFEGGQSEARGEQIIAEIEQIVPDKPIRYIVNSHPHSDHTAPCAEPALGRHARRIRARRRGWPT